MHFTCVFLINILLQDFAFSRALPPQEPSEEVETKSEKPSLMEHLHVDIEENEKAEDQAIKEITSFNELEARIYLVEVHLKQIAEYDNLNQIKFVNETDMELKKIDFEFLKPIEEKLLKLKSDIKQHNLELEDEYRLTLNGDMKNFDKLINENEEKLEIIEREVSEVLREVVKHPKEEIVTVDDQTSPDAQNSNDDVVTKTIGNRYEQMQTMKGMEKHFNNHKDSDQTSSRQSQNSKYLEMSHPYLVPGLTMMVFLLLCSGLVYKLARRKSNKFMSEVIAKDLGYTELETLEVRKTWDSMGEFNGEHKMH